MCISEIECHPEVPDQRTIEAINILLSASHRMKEGGIYHVQIIPPVQICRLGDKRVAVSNKY